MKHDGRLDRREFIGIAGLAAAGAAISHAAHGAEPQNPVVNKVFQNGTAADREVVPWKALPFPNKQVRLLDGIFKEQAEINQSYLHMLPNDRLAHMFRLTAGLPSSVEPLGGWEKPDLNCVGILPAGTTSQLLRWRMRRRATRT